MGRRVIVGALAIGIALAQAPARAGENPDLQRGIDLLGEMEDARAIRALEKALEHPGNTPRDRATIHFYLGVAHSNLFKQEAAEACFRRALAEDPGIDPPTMTAPKIRALFEKVRARVIGEEQRAPRPAPASKPAPRVEPASTRPVPSSPPAPGTSKVNWPAWITLGIAGGAGVAGVVMAVQFKQANDRAGDMTLGYPEAMDHHDQARSRGLAASILFATAGAAAVASGVLFYLDWREERVTASVAPTASGAVVHVQGRWSWSWAWAR
jgi:hypothetical protein